VPAGDARNDAGLHGSTRGDPVPAGPSAVGAPPPEGPAYVGPGPRSRGCIASIWLPVATLAATSFFLVGVGPIVWVISTATLRQTVTPSGLLGRVSAIDMSASGARLLGAALGALVGGLYGAESCLGVAALGFLLQAGIILTSRVLALERQPETAG
jgi:hypothetical protein